MVHADQKIQAVLRLLEVEDFDALIMFVRPKQATLDLASALEAKGYKAAALNGHIAQNQRERVIDSLKDGRLDIVLARSVEHTSELQSLMRHTYAVFCLTIQVILLIMYTTTDT